MTEMQKACDGGQGFLNDVMGALEPTTVSLYIRSELRKFTVWDSLPLGV